MSDEAKPVLWRAASQDGAVVEMAFHCPGCGYGHSFQVRGPRTWTWNGSLSRPTFSPSLRVNKAYPAHHCHLFVRDGQIQFLSDCHHYLAGKTVPMRRIDDAAESPIEGEEH